ncbi:MAG TPA: YceI family protein [Rubrivivax sp.]|nr:YceI family protein [Rubrivivax sp.]
MHKLIIAAACAAAVTGAQAEGGNYAIDPTHTFVTFEVTHFGTSTNRARFDRKEGMVQFDRAARTGRVEISIDMASVNSGVAPFDGHLRSKDILNVAEHPTAKFVGDKFSFAGDQVTEVAGTLTLMGQTHPVTLKANRFNCYLNPMFKREVCGGDFETVIQRSLWGVNYGLPAVAPDNVRLLVQVEAVKQ